MQKDFSEFYNINGRTARIIKKNKGVLIKYSDGEEEMFNKETMDYEPLVGYE